MRSVLATGAFWQATGERALRTFAQTAAATAIVDATGVLDVDWVNVASVSGLAAFLSVATSLAAIPVGGNGPSLTTVEQVSPVDAIGLGRHRAG
ncbi:holin [Kineococcus gynurae]|uniref:Holin n=1 Tax=Kineococcus gynurae TaxID=452979 RepID=A0ABV5LX04_9ACTN